MNMNLAASLLSRQLIQIPLAQLVQQRAIQTTCADLAKRKGFRIKKDRENKANARQKKLIVEVKKDWVAPHLRLDENVLKMGSKRYSDKDKPPIPEDNVFFADEFKQMSYDFDQAIDAHREVLDPAIMNCPDALVKVRMEFNLQLKRKSRHMAPFSSMFLPPNEYDFKSNRRILVICSDEEIAAKALEQGAVLAGGAEVIKMLKERTFTDIDYDFLICHTDMLIPLADVRNVLKDRFPNKQLGNFGNDILSLLHKFQNGLHYQSIRDRYELNYGWIEQHFGRLDMPKQQLYDNFIAFLNEIQKYKPSETEHPFITRVLIECPPNDEKFKIDFWKLMEGLRDPEEVQKELADKEEEKELKRTKKKAKPSLEEILAKAATA